MSYNEKRLLWATFFRKVWGLHSKNVNNFAYINNLLYLCALIVYYGELYRISKKISPYHI